MEPRVEATQPTPERDLGDYELLEEIGRGGMGVVYKANQISLNRIVAVKMLLHGRFGDPAFRRRFRLEAEAAAHLEHPSIVPIHEIGEHAGQPFFSMGWIDGLSLDRKLTEGPLPPERCAHITATLARAVHHAHQHGILHRDLKPHNVVIDADGEPHLTDFGLAKLLEDDTGLTMTETVLGSPGFVAPEQAAGENSAVTTASDVFSLGAILYMMLTGVPPFSGESPIATLHRVMGADPAPPRSVIPTLPRDLETICLKCLQKEPARRYGSAEDLAVDLERWMQHEPIRARPVGRLERVVMWCQRRPWRAGLAAALIIAVLVGGIGVVSQWRRAEQASRQANAGRILAEQIAYTSQISLAQMLKRQDNLDEAREVLLAAGPESLRGWEWGWLMRGCNLDLMTLGREGVQQVAAEFSPDSRSLITGGADGSIRIHDLQHEIPPQVLQGEHDSAVLTLVLSSDGQTAVTTHTDGGARAWNLEHRSLAWSIAEAETRITRAAISPDGKTVATGDAFGVIRLRDLESGEPINEIAQFMEGGVRALDFSPDGQRLAWGGETGEQKPTNLCIYTLDTSSLRELPGHTAAILDLAFSPDGTWVATVGADGTAMISEVQGGDTLKTIHSLAEGRSYSALAFTPDSRQLMLAGGDAGSGFYVVIDPQTAEIVDNYNTTSRRLKSVSYSPNGELLARANDNGTVQLWLVEPRPRPDSLNLEGHNQGVWAVAVSPDGRYVASGSLDRTAKIWESRTGRLVRTLQVHFPVVSIAFTTDGRNLVTNGPENSAWVWPVDGDSEPLILGPHEGMVFCIAVDPTGRWIATGSRDMTAHLWDATTGEHVRTLSGNTDPVTSITFSPDGERLATGGADGHSAVWESGTGHLTCRMHGHQRTIASIHFSPDGSRLATGSFDGHARFWDPDTGDAIGQPLEGLRMGMMGIAFSPDGQRLLTTETRGVVSRIHSRNRTITLWDVATGRRLWEKDLHQAGTYAVAFSPDGRQLVTGGGDNTARIWTVFPWKMEDYPGTDETSPDSRIEAFKRAFWAQKVDQTPSENRQIVSRPWGEENLPKVIQLKTKPERPIPPRTAEVGANQIDLSLIYNAALNEVWQPVVTYFTLDADLTPLTPGLHVISGTTFDLRGVIQLGIDVEDWAIFPRSVDIPVQRKIQRFHVVHATGHPPPSEGDGAVVGAYRLRFADGEDVLQPIVYGKHLRSYWRGIDLVNDCSDAVLAWEWTEPTRPALEKYHRLFMATFENPRPEVEVTAIEFISGDTVAAPFLVGMTME